MYSKSMRRIGETNGNVRKIGGVVRSSPIGKGFGSSNKNSMPVEGMMNKMKM